MCILWNIRTKKRDIRPVWSRQCVHLNAQWLRFLAVWSDQHVRIFCCLDSVVPAITKTKPKDVDEQSGLNFTWSETPKSGFLLQGLKTAVPLYSLCESDIIV